MTFTIQVKRSGTPGHVPSSLAYGEIAVNYADLLLYVGDGTTVQPLLVANAPGPTGPTGAPGASTPGPTGSTGGQGPIGPTGPSTPCFIASSLVTLMGGGKKPICEVRKGDMLFDPLAGPPSLTIVHGILRPLRGSTPLFLWNDEHWTTGAHPHLTSLRTWAASAPDARVTGDMAVQPAAVGMPMFRSITIESLRPMHGREFKPSEVLYSLLVSGSGCYEVDGFTVWGLPL